MLAKARLATAVLGLSVLVSSGASAGVRLSALEPAASGGLATVERALAELSGHRRLLVVGAHPDDEDNALLAYVGRGLGGSVAYLSLSRGEGGQNLIGPELGVELGIIRSGELLAARELEGTRQYFTRAYDFGYTRSLDETFRRWPRDELQLDALRVARRFKPQVIVSVFPASERARHGQHHAAAVIARDIYDLAGDPGAAADLDTEGLEPWRPQALYRRAWGREEATVEFWLESLDPFTGRSLGQLAAASRSLHRSQDMGREQRIGRHPGGVVWLAGGAGAGGEGLFAGVDTRLAAIAELVDEPTARARLERLLTDVDGRARALGSEIAPPRLGAAVEPLAAIVAQLLEAEAVAAGAGARSAVDLVAEKRDIASQALAAAAGVVVEATCDREAIALGDGATVELEAWRSGSAAVTVREVSVEAAPGWSVGELETLGLEEDSGLERWRVGVRVTADARPTEPYYLERPLRGDLYDWESVAAEQRGEAFRPGPLAAVFDLDIAGVEIRLAREVVHRYGDQAVGEIRRPLRAVPALEVSVPEELRLWPRARSELANLEVVVRSNAVRPLDGAIDLELPGGWSAVGEAGFEIDEPGGAAVVALALEPVGVPASGRSTIAVVAKLADGSVASASYPVIEYPHIRPRPVRRPARIELSVFDLGLPEIARLGYVRGASDRVPDTLRAVGLPVTILDGEDLAVGDLSAFDVIVIGSRAYETDAALGRANQRLLDYVRRGGTLVVQYQQYQFIEGGFAPAGLAIARPHGRVTDETAPVRLLVPDHEAFTTPNRIVAADWEGWVQERGLYFASTWDERFQPLVATADDGRGDERGALLVGTVGAGVYVYTGLSFFRQLPAGVAGGMRLFVNLLSLRPAAAGGAR